MDTHGQIRLEDDQRELHEDLATVALALGAGQPVRLMMAARMTRYDLLLVLAPAVQWVAAEPDKILGSQLDRWLFVGWERHGAGWIRLGHEVHVGDVGQALGHPSVGDHESIALFANALAPHILHRHEWDRTSLNGDGGSGSLYEWACLRCDRREWCSLPDGPEDVEYACR